VYDCPIDALKIYRVINEDQHKAAIAFREAYHLAVRCRQAAHERISQNRSHTGLTKSERMLKEAYKILPSYEKPIIIDVCGHDEAPTSEIDLFRLKEGLTKLSNYWNMTAMEVCN
jgi:Zn-dependent oligopeptidase